VPCRACVRSAARAGLALDAVLGYAGDNAHRARSCGLSRSDGCSRCSVERLCTILHGPATARARCLRTALRLAHPRQVLPSFPRTASISLSISDDYGPGSRDEQWRIGRSSLLPSALRIAPYKDTWWSSSRQPGAPYNASEPHPLLQSAVAALSTGPVTPGDGLGFENASVIERTCARDGLLLQPTVPAIQWDQMYVDEVFGSGGSVGGGSWGSSAWGSDCCNSSEVWISHTIIPGVECPSYHILAADVPAPLALPLLAADWSVLASSCDSWAVWRSWPFDPKVTISHVASAAFALDPPPLPSFELHHAAPFGSSGWAVMGEKDKWVPVAQARLVSVHHMTGALHAVVRMVEGEVVIMMFVSSSGSSAGTIVEVTCDWQQLQSSLALAQLPSASCVPLQAQ
jgi:hypothetical protein